MSLSTTVVTSSKRKDPPTSLPGYGSSSLPATITPTAPPGGNANQLSPYATQMASLRQARPQDYTLWQLCNPFDHIEVPDSIWEERQCEHPSELTREERQAVLNSLTAEQCEDAIQYILVPTEAVDLQESYSQAILQSDPRNEPGDNFLMLNTYSSFCMYPIISKQLTAATKEVNKAKKVVSNGGESTITPGVGRRALVYTIAAVLAADEVDHWRIDTDCPEECDKIANRVSKLMKDLLWFEDQELGLVHQSSRKVLLAKLEQMNKDWRMGDAVTVRISCKTKKNGQGFGRSNAPEPVAKKIKQAPTATTLAVAPTRPGTSAFDVSYLGGIQDKLHLRVKTHVQLKITSFSDPSKSGSVVVSGASDMKKINQVCAYVSGNSQVLEHHSQRGTCLKGSRIEVRRGASLLWLGAKGTASQAAALGAVHVVDKDVKIVQVFQGLNMDRSSITFDSAVAREIGTSPGAVLWVTPDRERYIVSVEAIVPNKCLGGSYPLPRLVDDCDEYDYRAKTGFGKLLHQCNRDIAADRQGPSLIFSRLSSAEHQAMAFAMGAARPLDDGFMFWTPEKIQAAGPPTPVHS